MKSVKEFSNDLNNAGIAAKLIEENKTEIIDLSTSDKKDLYISEHTHKYDLNGANFKIGDNFIIEIHGYESCEVHAGDNCQITVSGFNPTVTANNDCKIDVGWEACIYCKDNNDIECGEDTKIVCNKNNKIAAETSRVNIKGECNNEFKIEEFNNDDEQYYYTEYTIDLGENSKVYFGSTTINIK